mmetsp:Transcript_42029/g.88274  ORF Transcript_42029/g.88274 Transcript_42029/m.88274 type:complete len:215 (-) Transcript_42029:286-930(-)
MKQGEQLNRQNLAERMKPRSMIHQYNKLTNHHPPVEQQWIVSSPRTSMLLQIHPFPQYYNPTLSTMKISTCSISYIHHRHHHHNQHHYQQQPQLSPNPWNQSYITPLKRSLKPYQPYFTSIPPRQSNEASTNCVWNTRVWDPRNDTRGRAISGTRAGGAIICLLPFAMSFFAMMSMARMVVSLVLVLLVVLQRGRMEGRGMYMWIGCGRAMGPR